MDHEVSTRGGAHRGDRPPVARSPQPCPRDRHVHRTTQPLDDPVRRGRADAEELPLPTEDVTTADTCPAGGDKPGDALDQWANGAPGTDPAVDGAWINGNLNAGKSQYREGDSVGFRRIITGLQVGCEYRVEINYDAVNNGLVAYDYLTSWNVTPSVAVADPTEGVTDLTLADEGTAMAFPVDPRLTAAGSAFDGTLVPPREMSIFGGDMLDVQPPTYDNGTATQPYSHTGTTKTTYQLSFVAEKVNVVLAWGGHIAMRSDWDPQKTAPRFTNGSPYHMRLAGQVEKLTDEDISWNAGNQDRSLKPSAVLLPGLNFSKGVLEDLPLTDDVEVVEDGSPVTIDGVKTVQIGGSYTYVLTVSNDGEGDAANVVVTDTLPSVLSVDSVTPDQGTCDPITETGVLSCALGTIAAGASVDITIEVTVDAQAACGPIRNEAAASGDGIEPIEDYVWILVEGCTADLDLEKSASSDTVSARAGNEVTFAVVGTNAATATATATEIEIVDDLSATLFRIPDDGIVSWAVYDDYDPEDEGMVAVRSGTCDVAEGGAEVTCDDIGDLEPGQSVVVTIVAEVTRSNVCATYTNTARLYSADLDLDPDQLEPDFLEATATVRTVNCPSFTPDPDIELTKTVDPTQITLTEGDDGPFEVTYTYLVENTGNVSLSALTLTDDVLGSLTPEFLAALGVTTLPPGAKIDFEVDYTLTEADLTAGGVTNVAVVSGTGGGETVTDTDDATVDVTIVAGLVSELRLVKTALATPNADGDKIVSYDADGEPTVITYEYEITNAGTSRLTITRLEDDVIGVITLPNALVLDAGESATVTATHTVTRADADAGEVVNVAIVTATDEGGRTLTAEDDEIVGVVEELDVVEEKQPAKPLARTGTPLVALTLLGVLLATLGSLTILRTSGRGRVDRD